MEHKYAALLNPIRDLAENWCIDIASELEDYLQELEQITISFDGGKTNLNFAEAALVIQGSACIYSKKVEYLYSLVYNILDHFIEQRRLNAEAEKRKKERKRRKIEEEEEEEEDNFMEPKLLPLDDIQEGEDAQIDLPEQDPRERRRSSIRLSANFLQFDMPQNLTYENSRESTNFKLTSCAVHSSGALLLEESDKSLLDLAMMPPPPRMSLANLSAKKSQDNLNTTNQSLNQPIMEDDGDSDDEGDLPLLGNRKSITPDKNGEKNFENVIISQQLSELGEKTGNGVLLNRISSSMGDKRSSIESTKAVNIWEPLDPHEEDEQTKKPFKEKKTTRVPRIPKDTFCEIRSNPLLPEGFFSDAKINLRRLYHEEFAYIGELERKRRKYERAEIRRRSMSLNQTLPEVVQDHIQTEVEEPIGGELDLGTLSDGDDDADVLAFENPDEQVPPLPDVVDDIMKEANNSKDSMNNALNDVVKSYEDLCREHMEIIMQNSKFALDAQMTKRVQEWQTAMAPILEEQDKREHYDIEVYGNRILTSFDSNGEVQSFENIASGKPVYEICRLFLATLQLANMGNVELEHDEDIKVKLLNKEYKASIKDYRAPSIRQSQKINLSEIEEMEEEEEESLETSIISVS